MFDFKEIETFYWVATLGSFRAAAAKLNTTQPAISQRIAGLEQALGARVLSRDARIVAPTPRGRELLVYAEKLLGLRAEMLAAVGDVSTARGVLRLGVAETVVHTWLTQFVEAVQARFPLLALEIEVDISPNLRQRLRMQELDLAFLIGPVMAPNALSLPLMTYPLAFISSPDINGRAGPRASRRSRAFPSSPSRATRSPMRRWPPCSTGRTVRRRACTPRPRSPPSCA